MDIGVYSGILAGCRGGGKEWKRNGGTSIVPLKWIESRVYGDHIIIYPKPHSIYFSGDCILYGFTFVSTGWRDEREDGHCFLIGRFF